MAMDPQSVDWGTKHFQCFIPKQSTVSELVSLFIAERPWWQARVVFLGQFLRTFLAVSFPFGSPDPGVLASRMVTYAAWFSDVSRRRALRTW